MRDLHLLRLLQLFDSQFPIGAFAHSGGLETYGQAGAALPELRDLMSTQIALGWGRGELAGASLAWSATQRADASTALTRVSALAGAFKVIPSVRETSLRLGRRTLTLLRRLHPETFATIDIDPPHHAIVVGAAGCLLELPLRELLLAYGHSLLAGAVAAAPRCMPGSPAQAQALIAELQPALGAAVERAVHATEDTLFTCTPALDIRCHQQGLLHTRLFQS
jgi:urease accessory protein